MSKSSQPFEATNPPGTWNRYLQFLEDIEFRFPYVVPLDMLSHLKATYGQITQDALEVNRNFLAADWNPADDPIENVLQRFQTHY